MLDTSAKIGKDVIESLTLGMYEDCRFIYREYVQNAADAVDKAVKQSILQNGSEEIYIKIDVDKRRIEISDNATGISKENVVSILRNIAHSTKKRGEAKGFRGIGRLGGLGYCSKLRFETTYYGENTKSIMTWDAELLKSIINDRENNEDAVEVLSRVTSTTFENEDINAHYFRVIMDDVTTNELLDVKSVTEYLSMVAPVDINSQFIYKNKINNFRRENGLNVDVYNIYINGDQIYKPYTSVIYEDNHGGKRKVDDITDVDFILSKDDYGNIIYWGWYTISGLKGQMKQINIARGIRLRKENIQIGDEEICKRFFSKTEDQRFSFYYFGEIHAISKDLIPNSRRDYFIESNACTEFNKRIKNDFLKLKEICYDAQKIRSSIEMIEKGKELKEKIEEKERNGYTSTKECEDLQRQYEDLQKKVEDAKRKLANVKNKIETSDSPLKGIIKKHEDDSIKNKQSENIDVPKKDSEHHTKIKYRTDKSIYSGYSKKERKLIGKIYAAIGNAIADERLRDALICNIEEEITK